MVDDADDAKTLLEELGLGDLQGSPFVSEVLDFVKNNRKKIARIQKKRLNADIIEEEKSDKVDDTQQDDEEEEDEEN